MYVDFSEYIQQIDIELDQKSRVKLSSRVLLKGLLEMYAALEEMPTDKIT